MKTPEPIKEYGYVCFQITPEMVRAGGNAVLSFGTKEDFEMTNPDLIAKTIFRAMLTAHRG